MDGYHGISSGSIPERCAPGWYELIKDDRDIVSALLTAMADRIGKQRFELWFGPRTRIDWDGNTLVIGAPNRFFLDWIRANFRTAIEEAGVAVLGRRPALEFQIASADKDDDKTN